MSNPNPRPISEAEHALALAEMNLKAAKAKREAEERAEWKRKARDIAKEIRKTLISFGAAKAEFAKEERELGELRSRQNGIESELHNLNQWFRSIGIPLEEEEQDFERRKQEFDKKLIGIYDEVRIVQLRQGIALQTQYELNDRYVSLRYAHRNAKWKASGERPGKIEDGGIISL
jgi:SMC interacting uncharacterized protein involved in chromosome segregation